MSVDSINTKSNESLSSRAKGFAQQVLNLVNQALFDELGSGVDFAAILKEQKVADQSNKESNPKDTKQADVKQDVSADIVVESKVKQNNDKPSCEAPKTSELVLKSEDNSEEQVVVDNNQDSHDSTEQDYTEEKPEIIAEPAHDLSAPAQDLTAEPAQRLTVESEVVAASVLAQTQPIKPIEGQATTESAVEVAETILDQSTEQTVQQELAKPEDTISKIKDLKTKESKVDQAFIDQATKSIQQESQKETAANGKTETNSQWEIRTEQKADISIISKSNVDKVNLEANLQQFVAKSTVKEALLTNVALAEKLNAINPDNISSIKTASTSIKIGATDISSITGLKSSAIATAANSNAAFNSQNAQDRKLESDKNVKSLSKSQSLSVLEKVEAVLKKISESKDGSIISLRLDPPQLGSVRADVSLKDGVLHARLTAENPQVLQLLRERASDLQVTLRKMGLEVEKVSVSVNSEDFETFTGDTENRQGKNGTKQGSFFSAQADFAELPNANILDHWIA